MTSAPYENTAGGKKLENLHSLKSNEMAECSSVKPGEEVVFLPTHTVIESVHWESVSVEMHHQRLDQA